MHAILASWDEEMGVVFGSHENPTAAFRYVGDMQQDAETFARMCRYLRSIGAYLPPPEAPIIQELPAYTEAQLANAQRFTSAGHAYGNGLRRKPPTITNESFLDALGEIEL